MKIRILGNRVRLRLSQSEVDQIGHFQSVNEETRFGENVFRYCLTVHDENDQIRSSFANGTITISIGKQLAQEWSQSDQVGFQTEPGVDPFILIEKDFKCLTVREGEDEGDMFQNPNSAC